MRLHVIAQYRRRPGRGPNQPKQHRDGRRLARAVGAQQAEYLPPVHAHRHTVYRGHRRTSTYVSDAVSALSNIVDRFRPGEVYNVGGGEFHDIETLSDYVLQATEADPALVSYKDGEPFTTRVKAVDNRKAARDLDFEATVSLEEGVRRTVDWMRQVYRPGDPVARNLDVI